MESERSIMIAVFYGGKWCKVDDDRWLFKDYNSELTEVPQSCSYEQLLDEVYNIIEVDRVTNSLKLKYNYVASCQPCAPLEIRRDKDVKMFLRVVREVVPVTPLYVEILPRVRECCSNKRSNIDNTFPTSNIQERVGKGKHVEEEEAQLWESEGPQSPIRECQHAWKGCQTQVPESETPWETQVPETPCPTQLPQTQHVGEIPFPPSQVPISLLQKNTNFSIARIETEFGSEHSSIPNMRSECGSVSRTSTT